MNLLKRIMIIALALLLSSSTLAACDNKKDDTTEEGSESQTEELKDFDYTDKDMSKYITVNKTDYLDTTVTLSADYIVTDDEVNAYIDDERFDNKAKTNGDTPVTDQPIKLGDSAFIYYTGYLNGEAFSGGSNATDAKPYELSIGSGSFIPGFEDGLIGLVPDTTSKDAPYDLHVTFPENYSTAELAGKAVVFKVWVVHVIQYTIPELTDEYVQNSLKFDGTADEYKEYVKADLQAESDASAQSEALNAILNNLMSNATVLEYPQDSLDYWYSQYIDQYEYYMQIYTMYYGMSFKSLEEFALYYLGLQEGEDFEAVTLGYVKNTVKNLMIYYAIADQQGFTVSDADVIEMAKELAEYYSQSGSTTYTYQDIMEQVGMDTIRQNIIIEKVETLIIDECTIEYKDK